MCTDVDECTIGSHNCDINAKCLDTVGSFQCSCNPGYFGPGDICYSECIWLHNSPTMRSLQLYCCIVMLYYYQSLSQHIDENECENGTDNCHANANCTDTIGSFTCSCLPGFRGDGILVCSGII